MRSSDGKKLSNLKKNLSVSVKRKSSTSPSALHKSPTTKKKNESSDKQNSSTIKSSQRLYDLRSTHLSKSAPSNEVPQFTKSKDQKRLDGSVKTASIRCSLCNHFIPADSSIYVCFSCQFKYAESRAYNSSRRSISLRSASRASDEPEVIAIIPGIKQKDILVVDGQNRRKRTTRRKDSSQSANDKVQMEVSKHISDVSKPVKGALKSKRNEKKKPIELSPVRYSKRARYLDATNMIAETSGESVSNPIAAELKSPVVTRSKRLSVVLKESLFQSKKQRSTDSLDNNVIMPSMDNNVDMPSMDNHVEEAGTKDQNNSVISTAVKKKRKTYECNRCRKLFIHRQRFRDHHRKCRRKLTVGIISIDGDSESTLSNYSGARFEGDPEDLVLDGSDKVEGNVTVGSRLSNALSESTSEVNGLTKNVDFSGELSSECAAKLSSQEKVDEKICTFREVTTNEESYCFPDKEGSLDTAETYSEETELCFDAFETLLDAETSSLDPKKTCSETNELCSSSKDVCLDVTDLHLDAIELSSDATEPSSYVTECSMDTNEPSLDVTKLHLDATDPSLDATEPSLDVTEPSLDATEHSLDTNELSLDATEPSLDTNEFSLDSTEPSLDLAQPSLDVPESSLDPTEASLDVTKPSLEATESLLNANELFLDAIDTSLDDTQPILDVTEPSFDTTENCLNAIEPSLDAAGSCLYLEESLLNPEVSSLGATMQISDAKDNNFVEHCFRMEESCLDATQSASDATEPALDATEPALDATLPASNATEHTLDTTLPASNATEPALDATLPASDATEPALDATAKEPAFDVTESSLNATEPCINSTEPSLNAREHSLKPKESSLNATPPSLDETRPSLDETPPSLDEAQHSLDETRPSLDETKPSLNTAQPSLDATTSCLDTIAPSLNANKDHIDAIDSCRVVGNEDLKREKLHVDASKIEFAVDGKKKSQLNLESLETSFQLQNCCLENGWETGLKEKEPSSKDPEFSPQCPKSFFMGKDSCLTETECNSKAMESSVYGCNSTLLGPKIGLGEGLNESLNETQFKLPEPKAPVEVGSAATEYVSKKSSLEEEKTIEGESFKEDSNLGGKQLCSKATELNIEQKNSSLRGQESNLNGEESTLKQKECNVAEVGNHLQDAKSLDESANTSSADQNLIQEINLSQEKGPVNFCPQITSVFSVSEVSNDSRVEPEANQDISTCSVSKSFTNDCNPHNLSRTKDELKAVNSHFVRKSSPRMVSRSTLISEKLSRPVPPKWENSGLKKGKRKPEDSVKGKEPVSSQHPSSINPNLVDKRMSGGCRSCGIPLSFPAPSDNSTKARVIDRNICFSSETTCRYCSAEQNIQFSLATKSINDMFNYHLSNFINRNERMTHRNLKSLPVDLLASANCVRDNASNDNGSRTFNSVSTDSENGNLDSLRNLPCTPPSSLGMPQSPFSCSSSVEGHAAPEEGQMTPEAGQVAPEVEPREITLTEHMFKEFDVYSKGAEDSFLCMRFKSEACLQPLRRRDIAMHYFTTHDSPSDRSTFNLLHVDD